jgi:hypothetical protein
LSDKELSDPATYIVIEQQSPFQPVLAVDAKSGQSNVIKQTLETIHYQFKRLVLVIDTSASMDVVKEDLVTALKTVPVETEWSVIVAGDDIQEIAAGKISSPQFKTLINALKDKDFKGGRDNVPALRRALELAAQQSSSVILWVHGPQPVMLQSAESLRHGWERDANGPLLFDIQVTKGRNHIMEKLDGITAVNKVPRTGPFLNDFEHWLEVLGSGKTVYNYQRKIDNSNEKPAGDEQGPSHVVRLWAYDEIIRLLTQQNNKARSKAIELAAKYHLVTPVSGAVVLETQQQYDQAGLEPVEPGSVPTIPEPETWAMLIISLFMLLTVLWRQYRFKVSMV